MSVSKVRTIFLISMVLIASLIVFLSLANPSYQAASSTKQGKSINKPEETPLPIAIFSAPKSSDSTKQTLRDARNRHYNKRYTKPFDDLSPDTVEMMRVSHFWVNMPALPTAQSDAVILGEVIKAEGYVSDDKTGAYSEFTVRIERVFKDDGRLSDGMIVAEREGADVQLPDGRLIRYRNTDQGMPAVGRHYVLFLKYDDQGKDYQILTGYRIHKERVLPLDDSVGRFAAYKDADMNLFFGAVNEAVAHPPQSPQDMKRPNQ